MRCLFAFFVAAGLVVSFSGPARSSVVIEQVQGTGSKWFGENPTYSNVGTGQTFRIDSPAMVDWVEIRLGNSGEANQGVPPGSATDVLHIDIRGLNGSALGGVLDSAETTGFVQPPGWTPPPPGIDKRYWSDVRFDFTTPPELAPGKYFFGAYNEDPTTYSVRWDFTGNPYSDGEGWTMRNNQWQVHPSHGDGDMWFRIGLTEAVVPEPTTLLTWSLLTIFGITLGWRRRKQ